MNLCFIYFFVFFQGLKEKLHQAEEQLQATRQQAAMLGSELRDASGGRERTIAEMYRARQEAEDLQAQLTQAQEECRHAQNQLDRMRNQASQEVVTTNVIICLGKSINNNIQSTCERSLCLLILLTFLIRAGLVGEWVCPLSWRRSYRKR